MLRSVVVVSKLFCRFAAPGAIASGLFFAAWAAPLQAHHGMPRAQKHESRHEIDELEDQWRNAMITDNTAVMSSLLADDYMAITPFGTLQTKEEALANLRSGRWRVTTLNLSDRKVRFYGSTALVTSMAQVQGTSPEGDISGNYRYTRVYARDAAGAWKIVNFEANRIRHPGQHQHQPRRNRAFPPPA